MPITAAQVWAWMPTSNSREGQGDADGIMDRLVESVEDLWLQRWSLLTAVEMDVTASTGTVDYVAHGYVDGARVRLWDLSDGAPLVNNATYYVVNKTADTFKLASTSGGTAITVTTDGTVKIPSSVRPSYIDQALIMQAAALYDRRRTLNGVVAGTQDLGPFRVGRFDPDIERLLDDQSWAIG